MLVIKNYQIDQDAISVISKLIEQDMSIVAGYKLSKVILKITDIVKEKIELESKIANHFAKKDENGKITPSKNEEGVAIEGTYEIENDNIEKFRKEMTDLLEMEHKIDYEPFAIEDLGLSLDAKMTIKDIMKINFLFK